MWFIAIFAILFSSQYLYISDLSQSSYLFLQFLGTAQGFLWILVIVFALMNRRKNMVKRYRMVMNLAGISISMIAPSIVYLIPSLLFHATHNQIFQTIGFLLSACVFVAVQIGIIIGRWNWQVRTVALTFDNLPEKLNGTTLVQISDVHVGSFLHKYHKVQKAIDTINSLNADFVLFTGDLVNNSFDEMLGWEPVFAKIKAKKGKYSILGNHDYGDYIQWESTQHKQYHMQKLIDLHKEIGFQPLLNQAVNVDHGFWILGVENWGKPPFRQSGDLEKTLNGIPENDFKLLLSHDPSHFDAQVVGKPIQLTLSGHTHGMQFGIERFGIKWSPVSFKYPKWAGLYQQATQYLYVNRGFGFIGFPGRVGIYPEITHITLNKSK